MARVWEGISLQGLVVLSEDLGWLIPAGTDFSLEEPPQIAVSLTFVF